jgi:hypothetical protein
MDGDPEDWPLNPEQLRQLDRSLRCQICGDIYTGPVALACGHSCKFSNLISYTNTFYVRQSPCNDVLTPCTRMMLLLLLLYGACCLQSALVASGTRLTFG